MLEWAIRWGVPLALVVAYFALADSRTATPSTMANHALDAIRHTLQGMIPRL